MKLITVLTAKEAHADQFEKWVALKFDAPSREAQPGLAPRDAIAHITITVDPATAEQLVPVAERHHPKDVPHVTVPGPDGKPASPEPGDPILPEIWMDGRRYVVTIEPAGASAYPTIVSPAASRGPFKRFLDKLRGV